MLNILLVQESSFLKQEKCGRNEPAQPITSDSAPVSPHDPHRPPPCQGLLRSQGDWAGKEVEGGSEPPPSGSFCSLSFPLQLRSLKTGVALQNLGESAPT